MKTYKVEGWYRYAGGDEKDLEVEYVQAESEEEAKEIFRTMFDVKFYSITIV